MDDLKIIKIVRRINYYFLLKENINYKNFLLLSFFELQKNNKYRFYLNKVFVINFSCS